MLGLTYDIEDGFLSFFFQIRHFSGKRCKKVKKTLHSDDKYQCLTFQHVTQVAVSHISTMVLFNALPVQHMGRTTSKRKYASGLWKN